MRARLVLASLALLVVGPGCIPSNVVAPEQRAVEVRAATLAWRPARAEDLPGFYASTEVTGASAGAVLQAYYYLGATGACSGAALVLDAEGPRFLVLADDARWTLDEQGLDLGDGAKLQAQVAEGHLRLVSPESTITFRRVELK